VTLLNGLISVETTDTYGITGTTNYNATVDDTKTVAQMMTDLNTIVSAQQVLSQGATTKGSIRVELSGLGGTPAGDIEKGALFNFSNATDPYATGFFIPDVNPSILDGNGLVDLTNSDVTAFIAALTTAHTCIVIVTKGVRALTALKDALIAFRKHRKPLERKTREV